MRCMRCSAAPPVQLRRLAQMIAGAPLRRDLPAPRAPHPDLRTEAMPAPLPPLARRTCQRRHRGRLRRRCPPCTPPWSCVSAIVLPLLLEPAATVRSPCGLMSTLRRGRPDVRPSKIVTVDRDCPDLSRSAAGDSKLRPAFRLGPSQKASSIRDRVTRRESAVPREPAGS